MTGRLRALLAPALCTLLVGALLVGLGVWQLKRLAWKEGLIGQIEARTKALPVALPHADAWDALKAADYEYRHVSIDGTFDNAHESLVFRGSEEGPGYLVTTPLKLADGHVVLVNRGFVPVDLKDPAKRKAGEINGLVRVTGLMRSPEPRNLFTPADDPEKGVFFTRDPQLIASHLELKNAAPFTIDADATLVPGGWPRGGATQLAIPNNHLSYALTWFGLALGLFGVFLTFAWRRLAQGEGREEQSDAAPSASLV